MPKDSFAAMTCEQARALVERKALPKSIERAVAAHVADCPRCRATDTQFHRTYAPYIRHAASHAGTVRALVAGLKGPTWL